MMENISQIRLIIRGNASCDVGHAVEEGLLDRGCQYRIVGAHVFRNRTRTMNVRSGIKYLQF